MATMKDIGALIVQTPEIREGRPRIAGTGVTVRRLAVWYKQGLAPEAIADRIGHLTLAQVHAALAYYHPTGRLLKPTSRLSKKQQSG